MVVTRRQSAAPLPAVASRTNSSSGSSRSKGKGVDKSSLLKEPGVSPSRIPPNGTPSRDYDLGPQMTEEVLFDDQEVLSTTPKPPPPKPSVPAPKTKSKSKKSIKTKKRDLNKGISIFDILGRLLLVWFTIYTLSVCPEDVELRSPVCRALTEYRRLVLEPYVYPPIRNAFDHPSIAPHIRRAQPYYSRAVQTTMPWVRRSRHEWRTHVMPRVQWVQMRAQPYVHRLEREYDATLGPYVRQALDVAAECKVNAEPYILSMTLKTRRKWSRARPYVLPLWRGASHVPGLLARVVGKPLGDARRQWVDPQVAKIWAAVVEKGQADTMNINTISSTSMTRSSSASSLSASLSSSAPSSSASIPTITSSAAASSSTPTSSGVDESILSPQDILTSSDAEAHLSLSPVPEPTDEAAPLGSSIVMDQVPPTVSSKLTTLTGSVDGTLTHGGSPSVEPSISQLTSQSAVSASSVVQEPSLQSSKSSVSTSSASSEISSEPSNEEDVADDLEKFLSEIGLNDDPETDEPLSPPPVPGDSEEEEEEKEEERLRRQAIETAEKRAEIEGRHSQWEINLEKLGKAQRKVVRATLNRLREAAAEEARTPGAAIRMHVENLLQEAEKSLRSLKAYTKKLMAENKPNDEKIKTWENVVNKVDKKFEERVEAAADAVREWWSTYVNKEIAEVLAIGEEVTEMAHRAQADIGIDYSWLADVSYEDWQRYHKLVDTSKKFADLYLAMQNGTHTTSPANPLIDVMEALQEEVDDMVLGFEANLTRVKNAALDIFSGIETKAATNVPKETSETEVSILPIDPITAETDGKIPPVILSRGAEEVKTAVSRAEEAKTKAHEEL
ncbi:hypothetical protein JB92DRAFT_1644485 [Gautieria morchelliformis]|nr:hypothetical protein JB92DRAFT_1644485 [Gautieria morchelliformis]